MAELPNLPPGYRWKLKPHGIHVRIFLQRQNSWKLWNSISDDIVLGYPVVPGESDSLEGRVEESAKRIYEALVREGESILKAQGIAKKYNELVQGT